MNVSTRLALDGSCSQCVDAPAGGYVEAAGLEPAFLDATDELLHA